MARSIRAMLTGVAVAGLVAFGAGTARAQDVTVMTSVPGPLAVTRRSSNEPLGPRVMREPVKNTLPCRRRTICQRTPFRF